MKLRLHSMTTGKVHNRHPCVFWRRDRGTVRETEAENAGRSSGDATQGTPLWRGICSVRSQ
jgi:hypothetical protein